MEVVSDGYYRVVCSGCLSVERSMVVINAASEIWKIYKHIVEESADGRLDDSLCVMDVSLCWECVALLRKFEKFKRQVQNAHEHLRVLTLSQGHESFDHTYMSQSLSSLEHCIKHDYDRVYVDYAQEIEQWSQPYITITTSNDKVKNESYDVSQALREQISLAIDDQVLEVPELILKNPVTGTLSHIVVGKDALVSSAEYNSVKGEFAELAIDPPQTSNANTSNTQSLVVSSDFVGEYTSQDELFTTRAPPPNQDESIRCKEEESKCGFVTQYMTQEEMLAAREEQKKKVQYVSAVYKCELCIMEFYIQQQVEEHFVAAHRERPGCMPCKICYVFVETAKFQAHIDKHYIRYICKMCGKVEYSSKLMSLHVQGHLDKKVSNGIIQIGDINLVKKHKKKKKENAPKPGDLRKLLSKTTIVGYQCLECDMFFKTSRARKNHVARAHREGLQCDLCKKRFVNKTTLITHLRLHDGPLPREKCPICDKMVRVIQLKYHIRRHQEKSRFECSECNKVFSQLATYQAHLKYSRAHASDNVFKFPCPMCHKGYPTKEAMQDHFNYQHLGKTTHKCPICNKPIASKANIEKHIMRVHREKKEKPRNHMCNICGKKFSDKKALNQHEVIHSADRPLTCEICSQTFKQKASLYTHKKRVHKVVPPKRVVEFMDKNETV
ncbi:unnamed protein product [Leptosia nina]|uniref:C2H2-type domain-containing protein n=1 Tax=Leptosia nina TaxID=320188 RepID=A0AAV1JXQ1_9NEOP